MLSRCFSSPHFSLLIILIQVYLEFICPKEPIPQLLSLKIFSYPSGQLSAVALVHINAFKTSLELTPARMGTVDVICLVARVTYMLSLGGLQRLGRVVVELVPTESHPVFGPCRHLRKFNRQIPHLVSMLPRLSASINPRFGDDLFMMWKAGAGVTEWEWQHGLKCKHSPLAEILL